MRAQIVSSRVGGGHQSVAEALRQAFAAHLDRPEVWVDAIGGERHCRLDARACDRPLLTTAAQ